MVEVEAAGGGGLVGLEAVGGGEEAGEPVEAVAAAGDVDEGADDDAGHVVEEAVGFELEEEFVGGVDEIEAAEGAGGGGGVGAAGGLGLLAAVGGEADEVVSAGEEGGAGAQGGEVERGGEVPDAVGEEGVELGGAVEAVAVDLAEGGAAGVEAGRGGLDAGEADGFREEGVEAVVPGGEGKVEGAEGGVEMGDLGVGVHAGVGAGGALDAEGVVGEAVEGGFNLVLHGLAVGLALPALPGGAAVGEGEAEATGGRGSRGGGGGGGGGRHGGGGS